jgi:uncharacterized protein YjiK
MKIIWKIYIIAFLTSIYSCKKEDPDPVNPDAPYTTDTVIEINIDEPSGLALSVKKDALYTVSDYTGKIYRMSFTGAILNELPFIGSDMEGIEIDKTNGDIYTVEEGLQRIDHLSPQGILIDNITSVEIATEDPDIGFEGIAKNADTLYILFEKNPGLLIKYHIPSKTWTQQSLSFALDYSGIDYDESDNTLWIVSHESKTLYHCNLSGSVIKSQLIDVKQAEGIAIDRKRNVAWIVSDSNSKLHRIVLDI